MREKPELLSSTYAYMIDKSTFLLLNNGSFKDEDWIVSKYRIRFQRADPWFYLAYVVNANDDNEYVHKAVHKWLRSAINSIKKQEA